jgi:cation:H+ antiporter
MRKFVSPDTAAPVFLLLFLSAAPLRQFSPWSVLWTTPCILVASILITWGAESAQFFVAQGFALAILAWMQTLPEFAVEAVLAWKQQTPLLLANLTGALRLLTGLAWPMIYVTAATVHRRRIGDALKSIRLDRHHSVEVIGLLPPLAYAFFIWWKHSLHVYDACVLVAFYIAYLVVLTKLPPQEHEAVEDLETIPRHIVLAGRHFRIAAIVACFVAGGVLTYFTAEPFLGSLVALAGALGIPSFVIIQWLAPVISEFPEFASTFYFARQSENASVALVNITSSNINQWTLLFAMLPIVFSFSRGGMSDIPLDAQQQSELLLTISQSLVGLVFLANMSFSWWEALGMFVLFSSQLVLPPGARTWITYVFFAWAVISLIVTIARRRPPKAITSFLEIWREHVRR